MEIKTKEKWAYGKKLYVEEDGKEVARTYLYILRNELHEKPFGLMEDVFVDEILRGQGIGSQLVKKVIETAKKEGCYKLICTSRFEKEHIHKMYSKLGFEQKGFEFKIDFESSA